MDDVVIRVGLNVRNSKSRIQILFIITDALYLQVLKSYSSLDQQKFKLYAILEIKQILRKQSCLLH